MKLEQCILDGCRRGKRKYQKMLYENYYSYGIGVCYRYACSRDDALEILNDSFMKVFDRIKTFDESQAFKPWFRRIIINAAIDHYKQNRMFYENSGSLTVDVEIYDVSPVDQLNMKDLMNLLNQLPEMYRICFNLYEIEGYSHEEISELLEIGISTSRSNLTRAKKLLRLLYKKNHERDYERIVR